VHVANASEVCSVFQFFPNEAASPCSVVNWNDATSKQKSIGILLAIGYQDRSDPLLWKSAVFSNFFPNEAALPCSAVI